MGCTELSCIYHGEENRRRRDLLATCPDCGHYRDTPNHEYGCGGD